MQRAEALALSDGYFDNGDLFADLARRVAFPTESPEPERKPELYRYLQDELLPALIELGFRGEIFDNPNPAGGPFLVARRHESDDVPTVLSYGHGDVVRGYDDEWEPGLNPWSLVQRGDRWYGRGTADNKGQHTINLAALANVLAVRGQLNFNMVMLFETSEECGSPGLREFCESHKEQLAADVFIASDGPRLDADSPTLFMGSRGAFNFTMQLDLREGAHHSGNWGGLLANPGVIIANALATMISPTGQILVDGWRSGPLESSVKHAIARLTVGGDGGPAIDPSWGEPDLSPAERVFGSNTFEVLAFETGNPRNPVNAIPPSATVHGHLRFVVGTKPRDLLPALRQHLDERGYAAITLEPAGVAMAATRLDPDHPWAQWANSSIERSSGKQVAVLPNLGGSLPNDVFAELLGLPTLWVPHSYPGCSQHAPNEHLLAPIAREALQIMTGLWWDLGAAGVPQL